MYPLKSAIQAMMRARGYEIRPLQDKRQSLDASTPLISHLRKTARIGTLIDIGANNGELLAFLQRCFKTERSYAFEPLPSARAELTARGIPGVVIFPHALSDAPGMTRFQVNSNGPSSSILPVTDLKRAEFPHAGTVTEVIEVEQARLDDLVNPENMPLDIFVKIDVQGVEDRVIAGGQRLFSAARYVMVEMSFRPLYEGQALFEEVHAPLVKLGFRLAGVKNQLCAEDGEPLFGHFLYRAER
jgi:FkbM family methyltransferase